MKKVFIIMLLLVLSSSLIFAVTKDTLTKEEKIIQKETLKQEKLVEYLDATSLITCDTNYYQVTSISKDWICNLDDVCIAIIEGFYNGESFSYNITKPFSEIENYDSSIIQSEFEQKINDGENYNCDNEKTKLKESFIYTVQVD